MDPLANKSTIRFLSFANDKEDAEKEAKLREAAAKIEEAIARQKSLSELVDYNEPLEGDSSTIDPANDFRSLYERLQEQKDKKKDALEESKKLSNLISKLDEDDVTYLNEVAKRKRDEEIRNRLLAIEERKRLEEKKLADDELRLKESLKRVAMSSSTKLTSSSSAASALKSKLGSIKIKPKSKLPTDKLPTKGSPTNNQPQASDGNFESSEQSSNKRESSGKDADSSSARNSDHESSKRQKRDDDSNRQVNKPGDEDAPGSGGKGTKGGQDCYCKAKNITKCIGILPSMPQYQKNSVSSDDSDGNSDDQLEGRLVPRVGRRRR